MNIMESIIGYMVLSLLLVVSISYIGGIMNISYVAQSNFEATSILEKTEVNLRYNLKKVVVDKNKIDYEIEYKQKFLDSAFIGNGVRLGPTIKEGIEYRCYNYFLDSNSINIYRLVDNNVEIDITGDYYKTDEDGSLEGTEYINILCLYNTYNYIGASNIINSDNSPVNYILYSFYKDLKFSNRLVEKKGILYFN